MGDNRRRRHRLLLRGHAAVAGAVANYPERGDLAYDDAIKSLLDSVVSADRPEAAGDYKALVRAMTARMVDRLMTECPRQLYGADGKPSIFKIVTALPPDVSTRVDSRVARKIQKIIEDLDKGRSDAVAAERIWASGSEEMALATLETAFLLTVQCGQAVPERRG